MPSLFLINAFLVKLGCYPFTGKNGKFHWNVKASNSQIIMSSQMYATESSAKNGVQSVIKNAPDVSLVDGTEGTTAA